MNTSVKQRQIEPVLEACFGSRSGIYLDVLEGLKQAGIGFILINLPFHFQMSEAPSDLDLLLDAEGYLRARRYFEEHGWMRLDRSPGTGQVVYVGYDQDKGLVRVHLHENLQFFGVTWLTFEKAVDATFEIRGIRVAEAILDYFILHVEWFFRGKTDYPRRVDEVASMCDKSMLAETGKRLFGENYRLIERLEHLNLSKVHPTPGGRLRIVLGRSGSIGGAFAYMLQRIRARLDWLFFWRHRGVLVVVMGIDGSGKTTLAQAVATQHNRGGLFCQYRYLGLKHSLVQRCRRMLQPGSDPRERYVGQRGVTDSLAKRSVLIANLFNLVLSVFYILEYHLKCMFVLAPIRNHNDLVIVDRTWLDKLMEPNRWGNKLFFSFLPKPDFVVALHGDPELLYQRKKEFVVPILETMQNKMNTALVFLEDHGVKVLRIDTTQHDVAAATRVVQAELWQLVCDKTASPRDDLAGDGNGRTLQDTGDFR